VYKERRKRGKKKLDGENWWRAETPNPTGGPKDENRGTVSLQGRAGIGAPKNVQERGNMVAARTSGSKDGGRRIVGFRKDLPPYSGVTLSQSNFFPNHVRRLRPR